LPVLKLIVDVETAIDTLETKTFDYTDQDKVIKAKENRDKSIVTRSNCINLINNHIKSNKKLDKTDKFIITSNNQTKKVLKEHPEIMILNSDKNCGTVAMTKEQYNLKVDELLSDTNTYVKIENDPTKKLIARGKKLIDELQKQGIISYHNIYKMVRNPSSPC
jgi:hypothetical protein